MIRVLVVDDHPALRAGIWSILRVEPGYHPAGAVSDADQALDRVAALKPDVALIDYRLQRDDGLALCHRLRALDDTPGVLMYSAYPAQDLAVPAMVAGASGVLSKSAPPDALMDAIRMVARGRRVFPHLAPELVHAAAARLSPDDLPILGMLVDGTPVPDVAATLRMSREQVTARVRVMIGRLAPPGEDGRS